MHFSGHSHRAHRIRFSMTFLILMITAALARPGGTKPSGLCFIRIDEPNEGAFTILMPQGWQTKGGIFRVNAYEAGGPLNAMEAKCDLILKSDPNGTVSFHILPDIVYAHVGIGGGFFPPGSYYQGAEIRQIVDAQTFLTNLFSTIRPNAEEVRIVKITSLPGEKASLDRSLAYLNQLLIQIGLSGMSFQSDAAGAVFEYREGPQRFTEVMLTGIVDMRAAMTWKNTRTLAFRAPTEQFERWRPVMDIIRFSVRFNPTWVLKEMQGQQQRAKIVQKFYEEMRRIDHEIALKTSVNREEIMNDNFLVLTEQEEYVNPHTGEVEVDTDAFRFRWETPGGDIYYTNREDENPNTFLKRTDYKLTPVRKRRNE